MRKHSIPRNPGEPKDSVPKCKVYLRLPFKGDDVSELFERRISSAIRRTYNAADPVILYSTNRIPVPSVKLPLAQSAKSNVIYQFTCGRCSATYLGRTERQLKLRMIEHLPLWVRNCVTDTTATVPDKDARPIEIGSRRMPASAIARHALGANHHTDRTTAFKAVMTASNKRLLQFFEAIAIKRLKPELCKQEERFVPLALPW